MSRMHKLFDKIRLPFPCFFSINFLKLESSDPQIPIIEAKIFNGILFNFPRTGILATNLYVKRLMAIGKRKMMTTCSFITATT